MACVNPDGTLSPTGRQLLVALGPSTAPAGRTVEALAVAVGVPLFRIRASLREAIAAGLVVETAGSIGRTPKADELLGRVR